MSHKLKVWLIGFAAFFISFPLYSQLQSCPVNINFSVGDLSSWSAKTGLLGGASKNYPAPNNGVSLIPEFSISPIGIKVITNSTADLYGGFQTIPVINGYSYGYSVQIGYTANSYDLQSTVTNPGGFAMKIKPNQAVQ